MDDADKSAIPLIDRLDDYFEDPNLVSGKPNLYPFPPNFEPIPCKPLFSIWPGNMESSQIRPRKSAFPELQLALKEFWVAGARIIFPYFSLLQTQPNYLANQAGLT